MKKQLLIAAVAATMTSVAFADISITGGAKFNYTNKDSSSFVTPASSDYAAASTSPAYVAYAAGYTSATTGLWVAPVSQVGTAQIGTASSTTAATSTNAINHDLDFTLVGKSGDSAVSATFSTAAKGTLVTENVFLTTSIAGVNVKTGSYAGGDSNMGDGSRSDGKVSLDTTMSGIKLQFEDSDAAGNGASVTVSGSAAGVAMSHKIADTTTDTSISGSFGGVNAKYRSVDFDGTNAGKTTDKASLVLSTEMNGVTLTYADVDVAVNGTTSSDDFFGTHAAVNDMTGFGIASSLAGNKVALKSYDVKKTSASADDSYTKIVVTRPLASGTTFEVTYTDADMASTADADTQTLDLELAVKF